MIFQNTIHWLQGALSIASSMVGTSPFFHSYSIFSLQLDPDNILQSYQNETMSVSHHHDETEQQGAFTPLNQTQNGLLWLEELLSSKLVGKFPNSEYVAWKILDTICMLNEWEKFENVSHCNMSDQTYEGPLVFIPVKEEFLILFFGAMTDAARSQQDYPSKPPCSLSAEQKAIDTAMSITKY